MTDDSVLIMGFDQWTEPDPDPERDKHYKRLNNPYLEELLGKNYFLMPLPAGGRGVVTCRSFPTWKYCTNKGCRRLQRRDGAPADYKPKCEYCGSEGLYPAPFVLVCGKGHMDEFPWAEWAHSSSGEGVCENPQLTYTAAGKRLGYSDYYVNCVSCGKSRPCGRIGSAAEIAKILDGCSGRQPWLNDVQRCSASGARDGARGVSVRATSLYYPSVVAALSIPEWLHPAQKVIGENLDGVRWMRDMNTAAEIARKASLFEELRQSYSTREIAEQIEKRLAPKKLGDNPTETNIREKEFYSLMAEKFTDNDNLEIDDGSPLGDGLEGYLDRLKRIRRITEIRVIRAFTRGMPPDPYSAETEHYCFISKRKQKWYPAIENKGEGFLFSLNETRLAQWESRRAVRDRCGAIVDAYNKWTRYRGWTSREMGSRYILLHTISHVLIREVANLSGYGEASIRERIYYGQSIGGIMLYTANPSADGSLGGLVRQARPDNFGRIFRSAIRRSHRCARDPLCAEDDPTKRTQSGTPTHTLLNGAACYGCALLPETSCESSNQLLDRKLLFDDEYGFFAGME